MSNDDVLICILLGLCVAAGSAEQRDGWVKLVKHQHPKLTKAQVDTAVDRVLAELDHFRAVDRILKSAGV